MAKRHKSDRLYILTANALASGDVVFWTGNGWESSILEAQPAIEDLEIEALENLGTAEENRNRVVGAYLVPMAANGVGKLFPVELREQRRFGGPGILFGAEEVAQRLAA